MSFVPIQLEDYVRMHLESNRGSDEHEETQLLRDALASYQAGEADPSDDYEIAEACDKLHAPRAA